MSVPATSDQEEKVWSKTIVDDNGVDPRTLRNWVHDGKFPPPDGNLFGRNFWLRSTYTRWQREVLEGKYSQQRRPGFTPEAA